VLESAAFVENIPFNETRDYVKKVLSNAVYYSVVLGGVLRSPAALPAPVSTAPGEAAAADAAASAAVAGRGASPAAPAMPATVPVPPALREQASLVARLGRTIGPREAGAPASDRSLP
jgi:hypothetical protein